ncbi:NADPH-dependent F420 reductase [Variovorax sp. LARHSF232]
MNIAVLGAGSMGRTLARSLAQKLGHHVSIANSSGPGPGLDALAAEAGATPASVVDAVRASEIVFLAIPTKAVADLPPGLFSDNAPVVVDLGNYHPELRDGRIDAIDRGMLDSQWVARQIGRPVVKAFNNIFAASLLEKGAPKGAKGRVALPVAGDSPSARAMALRLVDDLGFDPVDAGDLDNSWRQQTGTPAYCKDLDAAALRRAFDEAQRSRIGEYRAEEEARIRNSMDAR